MKNINEILSQTDLFREAGDDLLNRISETCRIRSYDSGALLFYEGEAGEYFYILLSGSVKLYKSSSNDRDVVVKIVKPNESFAEIIIFESGTYPVSAICMESSKLAVISRDAFLSLLDDKKFRDGYIILLMKKMRYLTDRILYLTTCDVEERFFRYIAEKFGKKQIYDIDIPRKDIAQAIGTIPETFSRLTTRLKKNGLIKWDDGRLELAEKFWDKNIYE